MVPFESFGRVSYSPSIVTMAVSLAVSEIFGVKESSDLEIWVCDPSRSLKMARFDRPEARCIKERSSDLRHSCGALLNATPAPTGAHQVFLDHKKRRTRGLSHVI